METTILLNSQLLCQTRYMGLICNILILESLNKLFLFLVGLYRAHYENPALPHTGQNVCFQGLWHTSAYPMVTSKPQSAPVLQMGHVATTITTSLTYMGCLKSVMKMRTFKAVLVIKNAACAPIGLRNAHCGQACLSKSVLL